MIEPSFIEDLRMLANALRHDGFRFVLIGYNRRSIYKDISNWLRSQFPDRPFLELRFEGKDYRHITDELLAFKKGVVLIPDFDWLFREGNEAACVAFNQRRDAFARLDLALVCFVQPGNYIQVPMKVPDWWSLRSLELEFHRDEAESIFLELQETISTSSLGGETLQEKEAEIARLLRQIEIAEPVNKSLRLLLNFQIGNLFLQLTSFEKAFLFLYKSLELSQEVGDRQMEYSILNNIGQIYAAKGDYNEAIKGYQKAIEINPKMHSAWYNLGSTLYTKGDFDQAIECYQKAVDIKPDYHEAWYNMGVAWRKKGDNNYAIECYQKAIEIKPDKYEAWYNMGNACDEKGDHDRAIEYFQKAIEIKPDLHEGFYAIGHAWYSKGNFDHAIEYFQKAVEVKPDFHDAWHNLGIAWYSKGNYNRAIECYQKAVEFKQDKHEAWAGLGWCYLVVGKLAEAKYALEQCSKWSADQNINAPMNLGHVYLAFGERKAALSWYRHSLQLYGTNEAKFFQDMEDDWQYLAQYDIQREDYEAVVALLRPQTTGG